MSVKFLLWFFLVGIGGDYITVFGGVGRGVALLQREGGFLLSQEYLCLKSSIFLCECLMVFYPRCAALCHGIQLQ